MWLMLVELELAERRQFADLAAHFVQCEGAVQRLEIARQAEHRPPQFKLIEAGCDRQGLFNYEARRVTGNGIEPELDLAVGIFLVPRGPVVLHVHPELDGILEFRRRHVGKDVLKALLADVLLQQLGLETGIDAEQHLELDADVLNVAQECDIVRRVTEVNHRVRIGVVDVVDDHGVVRGFRRDALIVDDLDRRAGILDEFAERVGLRAGEFVGRIENRDLLDAEAGAVMRNEVRHRLWPHGRNRIGHQRDVGIVLGEEAGAGAGLVEQEHLAVARDRHRRRRQHRTGIGDQKVHLVLRDELIIEGGSRRGIALVVIGDELDRDFLVERLHIGAAVGILLIDPELERAENRHRDRRIAPRRGVESADLDFGRRIGGKGLCGQMPVLRSVPRLST